MSSSSHSRLAPSQAARWVRCPGSLRMIELATANRPERPPGLAARTGSLMHKVFELSLNTKVRAESFVGFAHDTETDDLYQSQLADDEPIFDEELAEWVQSALDWVHAYLAKPHKSRGWWTEMRLEVGQGLAIKQPDDCTGTADWVCCHEHELVVLDLKGGYVYVEVEDNYQLLLYTIGAVYKFERSGKRIDNIRLVIAQPRAGGNKELVIRRKELDAYVKFFRKRAETTYEKNAPLSASEEACQWCPAAGICPEAHKMTVALAAKVDWPDEVTKLSEEKFQLLLANLGHIRKMCDRAEELAVERLMNGEEVPGYKLVEGRSLRVWSNDVQAERYLKLKHIPAHVSKLITPAAAERELKAPLPEGLAVRPPGPARLARSEDPRKEIKLDTLKEKLVKSIEAGKKGK